MMTNKKKQDDAWERENDIHHIKQGGAVMTGISNAVSTNRWMIASLNFTDRCRFIDSLIHHGCKCIVDPSLSKSQSHYPNMIVSYAHFYM